MFINLNTGVLGARTKLAETIDLAAKYGFKGIDFSIQEAAELVAQEGIASVQAKFDDVGIQMGSWGFALNFRGDEAVWQEGLAALPRYAETAQELGCLRTSTFIMPCDDERTFDENFEFHVAKLKPAAKVLADHGCRLGLEFVGPKTLRDSRKYPFIHTIDGMLSLCEAVADGYDNVGLLVDLYHVYTSHGTVAEVAALEAKQVVTVHVNDAPPNLEIDEQLDGVRASPGETGVTDIVGFLHALRDIGYEGPVTSEPFSQRLREMPADGAVEETSRAMHKVWAMAGLK